jgi:hypothetical protein
MTITLDVTRISPGFRSTRTLRGGELVRFGCDWSERERRFMVMTSFVPYRPTKVDGLDGQTIPYRVPYPARE